MLDAVLLSHYPLTVLVKFRLWLVRSLPFLERWIEVVPAACCGTCPTCVGAAATGATATFLGTLRRRD